MRRRLRQALLFSSAFGSHDAFVSRAWRAVGRRAAGARPPPRARTSPSPALDGAQAPSRPVPPDARRADERAPGRPGGAPPRVPLGVSHDAREPGRVRRFRRGREEARAPAPARRARAHGRVRGDRAARGRPRRGRVASRDGPEGLRLDAPTLDDAPAGPRARRPRLPHGRRATHRARDTLPRAPPRVRAPLARAPSPPERRLRAHRPRESGRLFVPRRRTRSRRRSRNLRRRTRTRDDDRSAARNRIASEPSTRTLRRPPAPAADLARAPRRRRPRRAPNRALGPLPG